MTSAPDAGLVDVLHGRALSAWAEMLPRLLEPELVRAVDAAGRALLSALAAGGMKGVCVQSGT